jgi:putative transposase
MRITRSQAQWKTLIEQQQTSGLTIIDYCREHQLSTSNFYAIRKKLGITSSNFVRAKVTQQVELIAQQQSIELFLGQVKLTFPSSTCATYLGQVLRELA